MEPTLQYLERQLSLTNDELSNIILLQPSLLNMNITTNLGPKIDFYIEGADIEKDDVIDLLRRDPRLLTVSLNNRLIPRLKEAREAGLIINPGCLKRMARMTNEKWALSLAYQRRNSE